MLKCCVCGSSDVKWGARWNPAPHSSAQYGNFCMKCGLNWHSPSSKMGWTGQFGGTYVHSTLAVFEPFTAQELESLTGDGLDNGDL